MLVLRAVNYYDRRFLVRLSDWIMAGMMTNIGLLLLSDPTIFSRSPVFNGLSNILLDGWITGLTCSVVGISRLVALLAFGAFRWERLASFSRAGLALLSSVVWLQLSLGFWVAGVSGNAGIGKVVYPWLVLFEIINTLVAVLDAADKRRPDA